MTEDRAESPWNILDETCRSCRDELPYGAKAPRADYILWGKFFPEEALGPKCSGHAGEFFPLYRADQYAVFELRRARDLLREARGKTQ